MEEKVGGRKIRRGREKEKGRKSWAKNLERERGTLKVRERVKKLEREREGGRKLKREDLKNEEKKIVSSFENWLNYYSTHFSHS